ncbi:hypothetical protein [Marmoricola sp. RAF53]|uniref:hypothetical protein n=1 Tax=Marmoricola sp. RAF53 TaxID=3233059 RepID=UPI003F98DF57
MNAGDVVGTDEKVCPYCAEVIKAAAIKCRFCQSDLPAEETTAAADEVAEPTALPLADDAPAKTAAAAERGPRRPVDKVAVGLAALCLLLAGTLAALVVTSKPGDLAKADNGQVTSTAYRTAAMSSAAANASTILSYGYKTLPADQKAARAAMTKNFAKEYDGVMADAAAKATDAKLTLKATVMSTALTSLTEDEAKVLLFVNAVTTADGSKQQQLNQNRVLMTMKRQDGDWVVSKMDAF